jgi:isopenicillin-N epimerase
VRATGAAYYAGNLHKWVCAPKGAAFLYVRENRRASVRPAVISHGANSPRKDRSRFLLEFDWTGTVDPSPWLCVPEALRFLRSVDAAWMRHNRELALQARDLLCSELHLEKPAPDEMLGAMAAVLLPKGDPKLQDRLLFEHRIEVPIMPWPEPLLRVSAQLYNTFADYQKLASALRTELA